MIDDLIFTKLIICNYCKDHINKENITNEV